MLLLYPYSSHEKEMWQAHLSLCGDNTIISNSQNITFAGILIIIASNKKKQLQDKCVVHYYHY
jgi:hypothetical protein